MLRESVRTDPGGRPMLVATTLAVWATFGEISGFSSAHQQLLLLVSAAFKEHALPIELCACMTAFPAMLRDLGARVERRVQAAECPHRVLSLRALLTPRPQRASGG